jgi:tetratricopeptide (TPR) repeat protein
MKHFKTDRILFVVAALLFGAGSSLHPFLGESANLIISHAWIYDFQLHSHPFWGALAAALVRLPLPVAATLNIFSVLGGASAIALFHRVLMNCTMDSDYDERTPSARGMMALAGALCLMVMLPVMLTSNRAHYASFELLLLLLALRTLQKYREQGGLRRLAGLGLLFGVGMIESASFLVAAPLVGLFVVYLMWKNSHIRARPITTAALALLIGLALPLLVAWLYMRLPVYEWGGARNFWHSAWLVYSSSAKTLKAQVGQVGWIILLMVSIFPYVGGMWLKRSQPVENRGFGLLLIALIIFVLAGALLFNVKIAPWVLLPGTTAFPLPSVMIATAFGTATAFWTAFFKDRRKKHHHRRRASAPRGGRRTEIALGAIVLALVVTAGALNMRRILPRGNAEIARFCRQVVAGLPPRDILVTDGTLDAPLVIAAFEQRLDCSILNLRLAQHQLYRNYLVALLGSRRTESLIDFNTRAAIQEWLADPDSAADERIAFLGTPEWWDRSKRIPLSRHGAYYALPRDQRPDVEALYQSEQGYWAMALENFRKVSDPESPEDEFLSGMAALIARGINDFGVFLENFERPDLAREAYRTAATINPDSISAKINLYSCLPADNPARGEIEEQLARIIADSRELSLRTIMQRDGYVRQTESGLKLREIASAAAGRAPEPEPEIEQETPPDDIEKFKEMVAAVNQRDWKQAEEISRSLLESNPNYDKVWLLRGITAYQQKDYRRLDEALQRMIESQKFWPELVTVAGMAAKDQGDTERARSLFETVLRVNPNNPRLLEELLRLYSQQAGGKRSELYLAKLIEIDSDNYFANFMLGTILYQQGKYELALDAYEKCLQSGRSHPLLNNMAWVLNKLGQSERALELVDESIALESGSSSAWDTRAAILIELGDFARAEESIARALELDPTNISARISMVDLLAQTGRRKEAEAQAVRIESEFSDINFEQRQRLAEIIER